MKGKELVPQSVIKRASFILICAGPITTLAISPWFNFDPINPIKILFLTCLTFTAFGILTPYLRVVLQLVGIPVKIVLFLFSASLFSAFAFSDADKYQQFWGVFGRGTGVLSYFVLMLLFLLSSFLASSDFNKKVLISLILTTFVMVLYCLIQILKLDPIGWSAFFPFGTLGNVNFLSGYMGIALVAVVILGTTQKVWAKGRISLGVLFVGGMFALYRSDSTQGFVAFFVGISTYIVIKSLLVSRPAFFVAISMYIAGFASLVAGLFDKGPLRDVVYQFTVLFRADYMHAAFEMLTKNPLTGVGIDAYDDWYRSERGVISALRTSLNRTANSAHNIALDLGAGGGFPLILSYLALISLVLIAIIKGLKRGMGHDPYFMAASMSWVAYQVQATVSINQIGVGVWGWILGGLIVGLSRRLPIDNEKLAAKKSRNSAAQRMPNTPPPLAVIASVISLSVGFLLAYPPLKTDSDFLTATKTGSAELVVDISTRHSANAFILSRVAGSASSAGLNDLTRDVISKLIARFPRNLFGQLFQYESFSDTEEKRLRTLEEIRKIDPLIAICFEPNPDSKFFALIRELPPVQSYELARGWGLAESSPSDRARTFNWTRVSQVALGEKLASLCANS